MRDLCEITSSKRIYAADYESEGIPFFRGKEITEKYNGNLGVTTELFIARSKFEEIKAKFGAPRTGDLLLTSVGTLGSTYVVQPCDEFYFKDGNITWFRYFKGLDSLYLHYWLSAPQGRAELKKCIIGSSQSAYTIVQLKEMRLDLPPLATQRRIASILSAYDDLIENNTRRIAILEEMARRIYEEWFVRFRFPGHKQVKMVESELGLIPEGWEITKVEAVVERYSAGKRYDQKTVGVKGLFPVLDQGRSGVIGYHNDAPGVVASLHDPIIVFANHTCYQRLMYEPFSTIQNVIPFKSSKLFSRNIYWLQFATNGLVKLNDYKGHWPQFAASKVLVPPIDVAAQFGKIVAPLLQLCFILARKNTNLRTTRDLLLPKLISGELDVSNLPEPESIVA